MATRLRIDDIRELPSESYPGMLYKSHLSTAIERNCRTTDRMRETRCLEFAPTVRKTDPKNDSRTRYGEIRDLQ